MQISFVSFFYSCSLNEIKIKRKRKKRARCTKLKENTKCKL